MTYPGALPRSSDFLGFEKYALYSLGDALQALLGSSACVHGLECTATSPASMDVNIAAGAIYAQEPVDSTAFGILGTDANTIVKQGLLAAPTPLTLTAPATSGFSQVYLVQAAYDDVDSGATALPYYNSANPAQPLNGPNNSGTQQYTIRSGVCAISLKAGAAAATGSQVAPSVDPGNVGLYLITVSNGQTTITSGNISTYAGAPFIPLTLPEVPDAIQAQEGNYAVDTGSANAVSISLPFGTTLTDGMPLRIKKSAAANTDAVTVTVNSGSPFSAVWSDGSPLASGDWPAHGVANGVYWGGTLYLTSPVGPTIFGNRSGTNYYRTSATFVVPPGVYKLKRVRAWGPGGGGGGASGTSQSSLGGGAGGYGESQNVSVTPGESITITIGAGGAGGIGAANGSDGGTTTVGLGTPLLATGGTGGGFNNTSTEQGIGGTASGDDFGIPGQYGTFPLVWTASVAGGLGGAAAFSPGNILQLSAVEAANGDNGQYPGGGGNGALVGSGGGAANGGTGADGFVIIEF